jgi:hypothetical protein
VTDTTVSPVVDRVVELIETVPEIGLVFGHDPWDRNDIANVLVSEIAGRRTLRAWWVSGPVMAAAYQGEAEGFISFDTSSIRTWTYTVHGVEGLAPAWPEDDRGPGGDLVTLRANAMAVTAALDADPLLADTCAGTEPCSWPAPPSHRTFAGLVAVSYIQIVKRVITLDTPF